MKRYAAQRDLNEPELVGFARQLGAWFIQWHVFDWLMLWRGRWEIVEIKRADKEGWQDEYTKQQRKLLDEISARGGRVLIWRTKDDVLRDLNARATA